MQSSPRRVDRQPVRNRSRPGLVTGQLYQGRDLAVTTDYRAVFTAILERHLRLDERQLARVFPGVLQARSNLDQMLAA